MKKFASTLAILSVAGIIAGVSAASAATVTYYNPSNGSNGGAIVEATVADAPQSPADTSGLYNQTRTYYDVTEGEMVTENVGTSAASVDASAVFKVRDSGDTNLAPKTAGGISASPLN